MFQRLSQKTQSLLFMALLSMGAAVNASSGDADAGQVKAATCVGCHGVDGNSALPAFPKLAGLGHKYLLKQMQDIRDGRRPVALMAGQVDNMTDEDLSDIAAFYDAQERSGGMSDPDKVALGRKVY
jgi:cytochrome c553